MKQRKNFLAENIAKATLLATLAPIALSSFAEAPAPENNPPAATQNEPTNVAAPAEDQPKVESAQQATKPSKKPSKSQLEGIKKLIKKVEDLTKEKDASTESGSTAGTELEALLLKIQSNPDVNSLYEYYKSLTDEQKQAYEEENTTVKGGEFKTALEINGKSVAGQNLYDLRSKKVVLDQAKAKQQAAQEALQEQIKSSVELFEQVAALFDNEEVKSEKITDKDSFKTQVQALKTKVEDLELSGLVSNAGGTSEDLTLTSEVFKSVTTEPDTKEADTSTEENPEVDDKAPPASNPPADENPTQTPPATDTNPNSDPQPGSDSQVPPSETGVNADSANKGTAEEGDPKPVANAQESSGSLESNDAQPPADPSAPAGTAGSEETSPKSGTDTEPPTTPAPGSSDEEKNKTEEGAKEAATGGTDSTGDDAPPKPNEPANSAPAPTGAPSAAGDSGDSGDSGAAEPEEPEEPTAAPGTPSTQSDTVGTEGAGVTLAGVTLAEEANGSSSNDSSNGSEEKTDTTSAKSANVDSALKVVEALLEENKANETVTATLTELKTKLTELKTALAATSSEAEKSAEAVTAAETAFVEFAKELGLASSETDANTILTELTKTLDGEASSTTLLAAIVVQQQAEALFNQLAAEQVLFAKVASAELLNQRNTLRNVRGEAQGFFASFFYDNNTKNKLETSYPALTLGADYQITPDFKVGGFLTYSSAKFSVPNLDDYKDSSVGVSGFVDYAYHNYFVTLLAGYSHHSFGVASEVDADESYSSYSLALRGGYDFDLAAKGKVSLAGLYQYHHSGYAKLATHVFGVEGDYVYQVNNVDFSAGLGVYYQVHNKDLVKPTSYTQVVSSNLYDFSNLYKKSGVGVELSVGAKTKLDDASSFGVKASYFRDPVGGRSVNLNFDYRFKF